MITNDTLTELTVGKFILFETDKIPTYNNKKTKQAETVDIAKVIVDNRDGLVFDIQVITKDNKTFTNKRASIEINRFTDRCDLLGFSDGSNIIYIQTCDFMRFERIGNFIAKDISFEFTKKGDEKTLTKDVGINQVFNIRLYTDLLGTFGGEENGLIQTEADFKTSVISSNVWNKNLYGLNYFLFNFRASKFDDKYKYTYGDSSFSRQTLFQRNWMRTDIGFNIISGLFKRKSNSSYAMDVIGGFALSNFADSTDTLTVSLPYWGLNPHIKIRAAKNIGINLSFPIIWQYAPQLKNKNFGQEKIIISPEFEIFWNPLSNPGSKLFGRIRYVTMIAEENPFCQVQFGYTLALSEIINKKLEQK